MSPSVDEPTQAEVQKPKYSDAQRRATKKYRENNKDKVNEQRKKYYLSRKEKDPQFLEYKRAKAKEYYKNKINAKRGIAQEEQPVNMELSVNVEESDKAEAPVQIEEPVVKVDEPLQLYEPVQERKKRKYTKK